MQSLIQSKINLLQSSKSWHKTCSIWKDQSTSGSEESKCTKLWKKQIGGVFKASQFFYYADDAKLPTHLIIANSICPFEYMKRERFKLARQIHMFLCSYKA